MNLLDKAVRSQFANYFPNPEVLKKRMRPKNVEEPSRDENPYRSIISWFDKGNQVNLSLIQKTMTNWCSCIK
jgi:magnesium chelatase subunit I